MSTAAKTERKTNVTLLLETLERHGDLDADALQDATGIKKPIIVSTLFLAKQRGQVDSRPKTMAVLEGRFDFSLDHEATCKKLSRCGWEVSDIAGKLGLTEAYVETMLLIASAPKELRDMVERGMVDVMNAAQTMLDKGDRAKDAVMAMLGVAPKADGRKTATKGQVYSFVTYKGAPVADLKKKHEEVEPKEDFAAQIAAFFTDGASAAIKLYDSRATKRVVNLENFRGGPGLADGGRRWRDHAASAMQ